MSYSDKLKKSKWQKRRLEIFQRDNFRCQSGGCPDPEGQLEVHHIEYFSGVEPWDYPDDMLITLCSVCHDKQRGRAELEKNLASTLKMKGFLLSDLLALSSMIDTQPEFTQTLLSTLRKFQR